MCAISSLTSTFAISSPDEFLSIVADETTDAVGRCVLNILLIPDLSPSENSESLRSYLIESILLEAVNNSTVCGAIIRALVNYNIAFHSISAFVSDDAAYMKQELMRR